MAWISVVLLVGAAGLFVGCDRSGDGSESGEGSKSRESSGESEPEESGSGPEIVYRDGPSPDSETVLAEADGLVVTFGEYREYIRRSRLYAPREEGVVVEIPPERKADPRRQSQTVRALLEEKLLGRAAEAHDVEVTEDEIGTFVRDHDRLDRWSDALDGESGTSVLPEGLDRSDLEAVARQLLRRRKLADALVEVPEGRDLWEWYRRKHEKVAVAYVEMENTPTPDEIDAFAEQNEGKIEAYFEENKGSYRMPKLVRIAMVRPPQGREADEETLRRAAERLASGSSPEEVADRLELDSRSEAFLRRRENPEAFSADEGATGFQMDGPRGAYAWRVEGFRKGSIPELDRSLRREVAADMLRRSIVPSVGETLQRVLDEMRGVANSVDGPIEDSSLGDVRELLDGESASLQITDPFARSKHGTVPGLGVAEEVMEAAFALTEEEPVVEGPILSRGRAVALMLLERKEPSREAFERRRDELRDELRERRRKTAVRRHLVAWFDEHDPSIDLEPVQIEYGVLQK